jgi:Protein of unknown function (DUF1688)
MSAVLPQEIADQIAYLRSPQAIRDRCGQLFELACADRLPYFRCDLSQLEPVAGYVLEVTQQHYPDFDVPFHSRWRHFEVGAENSGKARLALLEAQLAQLSPVDRAKAKFDLAIVSVLLDAGAGADWSYSETQTGQTFCRSEGLAIASFWMVLQGMFSSDRAMPAQVDAIALQNCTESTLAQGFQVHSANPLVGLAGRTKLLQRLGNTLHNFPHLFGSSNPRPGNLVDYLLSQTQDGKLSAPKILSALLEGFADIWTGRLTLAGINLGDVWQHSALAASPNSPAPANLVPFHKLSQWLTYSLLEPLQELNIQIADLDALTGLPEYRNGGLCLDLGLLQLKDPDLMNHSHLPSSELIVEWRSLTVILLDQIAATIRHKLGMTAEELPLVKVLQGGTWTAGRQIAAKLRLGGIPPLHIESDGTVF